jgi:hypothetical protein
MTEVVYEAGGRPFEQRIGDRVAIYGLDVRWVEPLRENASSRKPPREWPGQVEEVSVTGASIRGPAELPLGPGGLAILRFNGQDSTVSVHRRQRTETAGVIRYGVEFVELRPDLKAQIYATVAPDNESPERWDMNA